MSDLPHFEVLPVVRCIQCRCDVGRVNDEGLCQGCERRAGA